MTTGNDERYSRQKDIVPVERVRGCKATVIGVGAIGRQVALHLAAIGIPWLQLVDHDTVEISNLASQGYLESDMGKLKVNATLELCQRINSACEIHAVPERFRRSMEVGNIVFCAVDKIDVRRLIWESVKDKVSFYIDGRMSAEVLRILTVYNADEAFVGPCAAQTTIYCANIAAGLMVAQFTRYLRQLPVDTDIQVNLLASEINVGVC
jgi:hypothetical protein